MVSTRKSKAEEKGNKYLCVKYVCMGIYFEEEC